VEGEAVLNAGHIVCCGVVEGEAVLNAGHIVCCGVVSRDENNVTIFALCLQTSALQSDPHELNGKINIGSSEKRISVRCSCKAGLSGYCKYCIAILLHIYKIGISNLEDASCTDLVQQWGVLKSAHHEPIPVAQFCYTQTKSQSVQIHCTKEEKSYILRQLCAAAPQSSVSKHLEGRPRSITPPVADTLSASSSKKSDSDCVQKLYEHYTSSGSYVDLFCDACNTAVFPKCQYCTAYFEKIQSVDCKQLCVATSSQSACDLWKVERKVRITGSKCYGLYTYRESAGKNVDWKAKI
jgi:hypothetical protein